MANGRAKIHTFQQFYLYQISHLRVKKNRRINLCVPLNAVRDKIQKVEDRSPQNNGIFERFHKTALDEFYRVAFRKRIYNTLDELQTDLDTWLEYYNEEHAHSSRYYPLQIRHYAFSICFLSCCYSYKSFCCRSC